MFITPSQGNHSHTRHSPNLQLQIPSSHSRKPHICQSELLLTYIFFLLIWTSIPSSARNIIQPLQLQNSLLMFHHAGRQWSSPCGMKTPGSSSYPSGFFRASFSNPHTSLRLGFLHNIIYFNQNSRLQQTDCRIKYEKPAVSY